MSSRASRDSALSALTALRRLASDRRGAALVEFAMVAPVLVGLTLPMVDIGIGFYYKTRVMTAAEAGAQYAFLKGWSGNNNTTPQTAINTAVTSATGLSGVSSSPAPSLSCKCVDGTNLVNPSNPPSTPWKPSDCTSLSSSNCTGTGVNPQSPGAYVTVNAQVTYTPLFSYLSFGNSVTLTASSTVRIQ